MPVPADEPTGESGRGIHVPLILAAVLLHWRNYRAAGGTTSRNSPGAARAIPGVAPEVARPS